MKVAASVLALMLCAVSVGSPAQELSPENEELLARLPPDQQAAVRAQVAEVQGRVDAFVAEQRRKIAGETFEKMTEVQQGIAQETLAELDAAKEIFEVQVDERVHGILVGARTPKSLAEVNQGLISRVEVCKDPHELNQFLPALCAMARPPGIPEEHPMFFDQFTVATCALPRSLWPDYLLQTCTTMNDSGYIQVQPGTFLWLMHQWERQDEQRREAIKTTREETSAPEWAKEFDEAGREAAPPARLDDLN